MIVARLPINSMRALRKPRVYSGYIRQNKASPVISHAARRALARSSKNRAAPSAQNNPVHTAPTTQAGGKRDEGGGWFDGPAKPRPKINPFTTSALPANNSTLLQSDRTAIATP